MAGFSTTFGAPGQRLKQPGIVGSPGNFARNAYSTGYGQYGRPNAGGYQAGVNFNPSLGKDPYSAFMANEQRKRAKPAGGGMYFGNLLPQYTPPPVSPTIGAGTDYSQFMNPTAVEQSTNLGVAQAQQAASPGNWTERLAANQDNLASLRSGQNVRQIQNRMMPGLAQAADVQGNMPIDTALSRYGFMTNLLGSQGNEAMGLAGQQMGRYGDQLGFNQQRAMDLLRAAMV